MIEDKYEPFLDCQGNETHSGDVCVIDTGYGLLVLLYSHKAGSTYVFRNIVKGRVTNLEGSYNSRFVQHNQASIKVMNLSKLKEVKTIER